MRVGFLIALTRRTITEEVVGLRIFRGVQRRLGEMRHGGVQLPLVIGADAKEQPGAGAPLVDGENLPKQALRLAVGLQALVKQREIQQRGLVPG